MEVVKRVKVWAKEKGIYESGTYEGQLNGIIAEWYEFRDAVNKKKSFEEQQMELGDALIYSINYCEIINVNFVGNIAFYDEDENSLAIIRWRDNQEDAVTYVTSHLCDNTLEGIYHIWSIAEEKFDGAERCIEMALEKNLRRDQEKGGKMINGIYVKGSDL